MYLHLQNTQYCVYLQKQKHNTMTTLTQTTKSTRYDFAQHERMVCQRLARRNAKVLAFDFENGEPVRVLRTVIKAVKIGSNWRVVLNKPLPTGGQAIDRSLVSELS